MTLTPTSLSNSSPSKRSTVHLTFLSLKLILNLDNDLALKLFSNLDRLIFKLVKF